MAWTITNEIFMIFKFNTRFTPTRQLYRFLILKITFNEVDCWHPTRLAVQGFIKFVWVYVTVKRICDKSNFYYTDRFIATIWNGQSLSVRLSAVFSQAIGRSFWHILRKFRTPTYFGPTTNAIKKTARLSLLFQSLSVYVILFWKVVI